MKSLQRSGQGNCSKAIGELSNQMSMILKQVNGRTPIPNVKKHSMAIEEFSNPKGQGHR